MRILFFQVHNEEGVNYSAYMRRIKSLALEGLGETKEQVRVLAVEVNIFGENSETFSSDKRLVIRNNEEGVTLSLGEQRVSVRHSGGRIHWL